MIGSLRSDRDRAIAGLMPFSGLRSAEVLSVAVRDVDGNTGDAAGHLVVAGLDLAHARTRIRGSSERAPASGAAVCCVRTRSET